MSLDPLLAAFVTESEELLSQMEEGLLALESNPNDKETLNAVFRVGHTVKGSAGILRLKQIVTFTHVLENVLDRLRKHEVSLDAALTSLLLKGRDVIGEMVAAVAAEREVTANDVYRATLSALEQYAALTTSAGEHAPSAAGAVDGPRGYRVEFALAPDALAQGQEPSMLLRELADVGEVLRVEAHLEQLPALTALDPLRSYLRWTAVLWSAAGLERLKQVFVFAEEGGRVDVRPALDCTHWQ